MSALESSGPSADSLQGRIALPMFETLRERSLSEISDDELFRALQEMKIVNPQTMQACGMFHEVHNLRNFCPDTGLLTCFHSYAFALIEEAIRRSKEKGTIQKEEADNRLAALKENVAELEALDMGGTFIEADISSQGQSGQELVPFFLERIGLISQELLAVSTKDARTLVCERIRKPQLEIAERINAIRLWVISSNSLGLQNQAD